MARHNVFLFFLYALPWSAKIATHYRCFLHLTDFADNFVKILEENGWEEAYVTVFSDMYAVFSDN